jgi:hypothetical protein
MRIRRAIDVQARHRVLSSSRVSRDPAGVSVLDWSTRLPVGRADEPDPAIGRIRPHPIMKVVDPAPSPAPSEECVRNDRPARTP